MQSLRTEIDNHEPWVQRICDNGRKLIQEGHENARDFELKINELLNAWKELKDAVEDRRKRLAESEKAHQVRRTRRSKRSFLTKIIRMNTLN